MRKAAAILLLFSIIFNVIGHFSLLFFLQRQIKKEIKIIINSNLNQDDIEIIEIQNSEFRIQKPEVRSKKLEDSRQITEQGSRKTEISNLNTNDIKYFHRIDKGEFRYKGKMYDIVKEVKTNESVIFYCINDKKEEQLISQFSEQIKNSLGSNSPIGKMMKKLINFSINDLFFFMTNHHFIPYSTNIISIFQSISVKSLKLDIPSPPPKYIS